MNSRKSSRRIYIGGISTKRVKSELEEMFQEVGPLEACVIYEDEAYMEYKSEEEARKAIDKFDGEKYLGQRLQVEWAHLEANKRRRSPLRDVQCYNCEGYGHFQRDCPEKNGYGRRDFRGGRRSDRRDFSRRYDDRDSYRRDRRDRDFDRRDRYRDRDRRDRDFDRRDRYRDRDRRDRDYDRRDDDRDRRDRDYDRRDDDRDRRNRDDDSRDDRRQQRNNRREDNKDDVSRSSRGSVSNRKNSVEKNTEKKEEITRNGDTQEHRETEKDVEEKQDQHLY